MRSAGTVRQLHADCLEVFSSSPVSDCGGVMADWSQLAWAPVLLSMEHVEFDTSSLETEEQVHEVQSPARTD
jgi:hypothetical protein